MIMVAIESVMTRSDNITKGTRDVTVVRIVVTKIESPQQLHPTQTTTTMATPMIERNKRGTA